MELAGGEVVEVGQQRKRGPNHDGEHPPQAGLAEANRREQEVAGSERDESPADRRVRPEGRAEPRRLCAGVHEPGMGLRVEEGVGHRLGDGGHCQQPRGAREPAGPRGVGGGPQPRDWQDGRAEVEQAPAQEDLVRLGREGDQRFPASPEGT
jgi:hypothetical protein